MSQNFDGDIFAETGEEALGVPSVEAPEEVAEAVVPVDDVAEAAETDDEATEAGETDGS